VKFNFNLVFDLFNFLKENKIAFELARSMMPVLYEHPKMDFESILTSIGFKRIPQKEILSHIPFLKEKFASIRHSMEPKNETDWIMDSFQPCPSEIFPCPNYRKPSKNEACKHESWKLKTTKR